MGYMRKDVWNLGDGWSEPLIWYAKAIKVMQARPITDVTSWTFLAAMHGFDPDAWTAFGYLTDPASVPDDGLQKTYWRQCQHQSWFFLPWHRGYLWSFENIVRAAVVGLGGPADWALPYWNYNNANQSRANELPPAFAAAAMPDGAPNPLFITRRYGLGTMPIVVPRNLIRPVAQDDDHFTGGEGEAHPGFGGPYTIFHHGGEDDAPNGGLESEPHNNVHSLVGGNIPNTDQNDPKNGGLMAWPDQAALDPIFWLHHANIDRLWEVWRNNNPAHRNPPDKAWAEGPVNRVFAVPDASGKKVTFTPKDMQDTRALNLGYSYEDDTTPTPSSRRSRRLEGLGVPPLAAVQAMESVSMEHPAEIMGANDGKLNLSAGAVATKVRLDKPTKARLVESLNAALSAPAPKEPDRVFLKLENIRGFNDAALFSVYVGLPPEADPASHPENLAGTVSMFGVSKASRDATGSEGGNGLTQVFDISSIVDSLHLHGGLQDLESLDVRFVPYRPVRPESRISVGSVKMLRQQQ